jgi:hypothetical membrane protein
MNSKQQLFYKIGGFCGVFAPIVAFSCIAFAIYYSPWFTWTGNWLSDLGGMPGEEPIWAARGVASIVFNIGLIITGVLGIIFAYTVRKLPMFNTFLGRIGTNFLLLNTIAQCTIGIFPETTGHPHTAASLAFFFLIFMSLLPIGTVIRKTNRKKLGWFVTLLGIISFCSLPLLLAPQPWGSNAIAEMFLIVSISQFSVVFGIYLFKQKIEMT